MKSAWQTVRLGEVLAQNKKYIYSLENQEYARLSVKLYGKGCVVQGSVLGSEVKMKRHQLAKPGQVILSEIWGKKGAIGFVPDDGDRALVTSHFFLFDLDATRVLPAWLHWLIQANYFEVELSEYARGSTGYAAVRPNQFVELKIPLPPVDEQRRIIARINAFNGKIDEATAMLSVAISETEAVVASESNALFSRATATDPTLPVGKVFTYRNELIRPRDGSHGPVRFVGLQHIEPHTGRCLGEDWLIAEDLKGRKFKFSPGEILYGYLRPYLNKVWVADRDGICSVDQYVLRPKPDMVDTHYLAHFMRSPIFLKQAIEGTHSLQLPRLGTKLLEAIPIPLPAMAEQRRIVERLSKLQSKVADLGQLQAGMQAELEALLPSVLDKAFKGEM